MTTYTELKQQILDYCETDSAVLTDVIMNDIIEHAEHRIFRSIELDNQKEYLNGNTAPNNRFVLLPGYSSINVTKPDINDIATIRYVTLYTDSGTKERHELVRVDVDFLNEYYPTPEVGSTAKPRYYSTWDMGQIAIEKTNVNVVLYIFCVLSIRSKDVERELVGGTVRKHTLPACLP